MGSLKLIRMLLVVCSILAFSAFALPPALPTSLHGEVILFSLDNATQEINITARWIDSDRQERNTTTTTNAEGAYFFNQGFIQARENSKIKIDAEGMVSEVQSNPGGAIVEVPIIIVSRIGEPNEDNANNKNNSYLDCPECSITQGENNLTPQYYNQTDNLTVENSSIEEYEGQYYGTSNINRTKRKAPSSVKRINGTSGSAQNNVKNNLNKKLTDNQENYSATNISRKIVNIIYIFKNTSESIANGNISNIFKERIKFKLSTLIIILLVIIGTIFAFLLAKRIIVNDALYQKIQLRNIEGAIRKLYSLQASQFMDTSYEAISPEGTLEEIMGIFNSTNADCVVVENMKRPQGIITRWDILQKINFSKELNEINAKEIMVRPLKTVTEKERFADIYYKINNLNISALPIIRKEKMIGIVTTTTLAIKYRELFEQFFSKKFDFPYVTKVMGDNVIVGTETDFLKGIIKKMIEKNCELILVAQEGSSEDDATYKVIGNISESEIIEILYNYHRTINKISLKSTLSTREMTIIPTTNIFEANQKMIEKNIKKLLIIDNNQFIGVITQKSILKGIHSYLSEKFRTGKKD